MGVPIPQVHVARDDLARPSPLSSLGFGPWCVSAALAGTLGLLQLACSNAPAPVHPALSFVAVETVPVAAPPKLEPGRPLERDLAGGQRDEITLALEAGQYARLSLDQRHLDVAATLLDPAGQPIDYSVDGPGGQRVPEIVSLVTTTGGGYRLDPSLPMTSRRREPLHRQAQGTAPSPAG